MIIDAEQETERFADRHAGNLNEIKKHAIASLRSVIEQLPIKKADLKELVDSIGKSVWLQMLLNLKKNDSASKKVRRNLQNLFDLAT